MRREGLELFTAKSSGLRETLSSHPDYGRREGFANSLSSHPDYDKREDWRIHSKSKSSGLRDVRLFANPLPAQVIWMALFISFDAFCTLPTVIYCTKTNYSIAALERYSKRKNLAQNYCISFTAFSKVCLCQDSTFFKS